MLAAFCHFLSLFSFLLWAAASLSALHFIPHRSDFLNLPKEMPKLWSAALKTGKATWIWDTQRQKVLVCFTFCSSWCPIQHA